jgi:hypothetical protein
VTAIGDLERGRAGAALLVDAGYAEPPDHRSALREAGTEALPTLTSNSIIVLYTHVKTGRWSSVMPAKLADTLGLSDAVRAIPIVEPKVDYSIRTGCLAPRSTDSLVVGTDPNCPGCCADLGDIA